MIRSSNNLKLVLNGVFAAALTPCKADLSCDFVTMAEHCKDLLKRGCSGVLIFGTTGEGASFSVEERKKMLKSLVDSGVNPNKILVSISCCAIPDAVELAKDALAHQCAAVLILPPFFNKPVDDEGVIAFYWEVITRVGNPTLRVILYHIPQLSGVPITIPIIRRLLSEFPEQVIGIKESEGNMKLVQDIRQEFPDFSVFVGNEMMISDAVRLGAAGSIAGMANVFPELLRSLYEFGKGFYNNDENKKMAAIREVIRRYPFIAALKSFLENTKGSAWQTLRPPLLPLEKRQSTMLNQDLESFQ